MPIPVVCTWPFRLNAGHRFRAAAGFEIVTVLCYTISGPFSVCMYDNLLYIEPRSLHTGNYMSLPLSAHNTP